MAITTFSGKYRFLSNFALSRICDDEGWWMPSVEHAYQAAKTTDEMERRRIQHAVSPSIAKALGKHVPLRPHWDQIKLTVMYGLLLRKFQIPEFRAQLLATGDEELIEGNTWGDAYWGCCGGRGENHLGKLLMHIRQEIRDGQANRPTES